MATTALPVQFVSAVSAGTQSSVTTAPIATTAGNLLVVVVVAFGNNVGATPVTDSEGETWQVAIASTGTTEGFAAMFFVPNIGGDAAHTFTFTPSTADFLAIGVVEIESADLSSPLNDTSSSSAASSTRDSGDITANAAVPELWVGALSVSRIANNNPPLPQLFAVGLNVDATASTEGIVLTTRVVNPNTVGALEITTGGATNETIMLAGFKAAPSVGSGGGSFPFLG